MCTFWAKPRGKSIGNNADKRLPFHMHEVGYKTWWHSEFEEDWQSGFRVRAWTRVSWEGPRVSAGICSRGARGIKLHTEQGLDNTNWTVKFGEGVTSRSCVFRAKSAQNVRFSEPLPQKCHLGLALRYVPKGLERWNFTRRKASRFSTGLYSLVKLQQVENAFLEQKVVKMCGFRNPCPKCSSWLNSQKFSHEGLQCNPHKFLLPCTVRYGYYSLAGEHAWRPAGPARGRWGRFSAEK